MNDQNNQQLNVNALTVQRGTDVPNQLQPATAVTLEIRTLDPLSVSNERSSDLELDLAMAFLLRIIAAGGERAEKLRRMFDSAAPKATARETRRRLPRQWTAREIADARQIVGGDCEPDVDVIDVDEDQ